MDSRQIEEYLTLYGWTYQVSADRYLVEFIGEEHGFLLVIQLTHPWLRIVIPNVIPAPSETVGNFWKTLLNFNSQTRLVRIATDDYGRLNLVVDLFSENLEYRLFEIALDTIAYFAERVSELFSESLDASETDMDSSRVRTEDI